MQDRTFLRRPRQTLRIASLVLSTLTLVGCSVTDALGPSGSSPSEVQATQGSGAFEDLSIQPLLDPDCLDCVFGPVTYERSTSAPELHSLTFPADPLFQYRLVAQTLGSGAIVTVNLNGDSHVAARDLAGKREEIAVPAELQALNQVDLEIAGEPGSLVRVWIEPLPLTLNGVAAAPTADPRLPAFAVDESGAQFLAVADPGSGTLIGAAAGSIGGDDQILVFLGDDGLPALGVGPNATFHFEGWADDGTDVTVDLAVFVEGETEVFSGTTTLTPAGSAAFRELGGAAPVPSSSLTAPGPVSASRSPSSSPSPIDELRWTGLVLRTFTCTVGIIGVKEAAVIDWLPSHLGLDCAGAGIDALSQLVPADADALAQTAFAVKLGVGALECFADPLLGCLRWVADTWIETFDRALPTRIEPVSGDGQVGVIDTDLADLIVVQVLNRRGWTLRNIKVTFEVATGDGIVGTPPSAVMVKVKAGAGGIASTNWRLGPVVGQQHTDAYIQNIFASVTGHRFTALANERPAFRDDFDDGFGQWTRYGSPLPQIRASAFGRSDVFDNNGDAGFASGAVSNAFVTSLSGFTIETEVYVDVQNEAGCWAQPGVGISAQSLPNGGAGGGSNLPSRAIRVNLTYEGDACFQTPAQFRRHGWFRIRLAADDGTTESVDPGDILADGLMNRWVTLRVEVGSDRFVHVFADGVHQWTSSKRLDAQHMTDRNLVIGDRSSGSAGKGYHDFVEVRQN